MTSARKTLHCYRSTRAVDNIETDENRSLSKCSGLTVAHVHRIELSMLSQVNKQVIAWSTEPHALSTLILGSYICIDAFVQIVRLLHIATTPVTHSENSIQVHLDEGGNARKLKFGCSTSEMVSFLWHYLTFLYCCPACIDVTGIGSDESVCQPMAEHIARELDLLRLTSSIVNAVISLKFWSQWLLCAIPCRTKLQIIN